MKRVLPLPEFDVTDEEVAALTNTILDFVENKSHIIANSTKNRVSTYSDEFQEKQVGALTKLKAETVICNHIIFRLELIEGVFEQFPWVRRLYRLGDVGSEAFNKYSKNVLALVLKNGKMFHPHIDKTVSADSKSARDNVVNFPLVNYESSKTHFYRLKDKSLFNGSYIFPLEDLEKTETIVYKKNQPAMLDAKIIHSVDVADNFDAHKTRVVLTCGVAENENWEAELAEMGTNEDNLAELAKKFAVFG